VSKTPLSFGKWLIVNASGLHESGEIPAAAGANRLADLNVPAAPERSPTAGPGLPSEWLFSVAVEPILIVDAATQQVLQANPSAAELVRISQRLLIGSQLKDVFDASSEEAIQRSFERASTAGYSEEISLRTIAGSTKLSARLSLFRAGTQNYLLVRLTAAADATVEQSLGATQTPVFDAIEGASVGFLVTDSGLRVEYANRAFLDMIGLQAFDQVLGKSLVRWLELSDADLAGFQDQMLHREASSLITAALRTEQNLRREVEVCAVAVPDGHVSCWGFTLQELPRLN
jgi:PAS domain-containing protein